MRFTAFTALLCLLASLVHGCSSSSSAQSLPTITVNLPGPVSEIANLTPLDSATVVFRVFNDTWVSDYTDMGTQPLITDLRALTLDPDGPGLVWNGNTFLIESDVFASNNTSTGEIWMTDGTAGGTVPLAMLNDLDPTSTTVTLFGASVEGNHLVVAYRLNRVTVPSDFVVRIMRIAL